MKTFKEFIEETYIKPKAKAEIGEVPFQRKVQGFPSHVHKQLDHISNINNFRKALSSAKVKHYDAKKIKNVDNTDAATPKEFKKLHPTKQKRVAKIFNKGRGVETPIILKHKESGHEHLLSGNTRATYGMKRSKRIKASVIEY